MCKKISMSLISSIYLALIAILSIVNISIKVSSGFVLPSIEMVYCSLILLSLVFVLASFKHEKLLLVGVLGSVVSICVTNMYYGIEYGFNGGNDLNGWINISASVLLLLALICAVLVKTTTLKLMMPTMVLFALATIAMITVAVLLIVKQTQGSDVGAIISYFALLLASITIPFGAVAVTLEKSK